MSARKKPESWAEFFLWLILILFGLVFLYQFMKAVSTLVSAGESLLSALMSALPDALTNTISSIESALTAAAVNPLSLFTNFFSFIPSFLSLTLSFFTGIFNAILGTSLLAGSTGLIALGAANPITTGLGASYVATNPNLPVISGAGGNSSNVSTVNDPNSFSAGIPQ